MRPARRELLFQILQHGLIPRVESFAVIVACRISGAPEDFAKANLRPNDCSKVHSLKFSHTKTLAHVGATNIVGQQRNARRDGIHTDLLHFIKSWRNSSLLKINSLAIC